MLSRLLEFAVLLVGVQSLVGALWGSTSCPAIEAGASIPEPKGWNLDVARLVLLRCCGIRSQDFWISVFGSGLKGLGGESVGVSYDYERLDHLGFHHNPRRDGP